MRFVTSSVSPANRARRRPESNRCRRLCRPLRSHSATSPRAPSVAASARPPVTPLRRSAAARRRCPTGRGRCGCRGRCAARSAGRRRRRARALRRAPARPGSSTSNERRPTAPGGRRPRARAVPGVEPEVVVVAAGRDEQRARVAADHHVEAEHAAVERLGLRAARTTCRWTWPIARAGRRVGLATRRRRELAEQRRRGPAAASPSRAGRRSPPLIARTVAVDLDPVAVRVRQVQRLADEVVRRAVERPAGAGQPGEREREVQPRRDAARRGGTGPVARRSSARRGAVAVQLDERRPVAGAPSATVPSSQLRRRAARCACS